MENRILTTLIGDLEKLTEDLKALAAEGQQAPEAEKVKPEEKYTGVQMTLPDPSVPESVEEPKMPQQTDKVIEFTEVRKLLAKLSAEGHTEQVRKLIQGFGVNRLSDVPQEMYPELMQKAEVLNEK